MFDWVLNAFLKHLHGLQLELIDSEDITSNALNIGRLNLNPRGLGEMAIKFIRRMN